MKNKEYFDVGIENSLRTFIQALPFGGALDRGIFGSYDLIQQKRIETFLIDVKEYFEGTEIERRSIEAFFQYLETHDGIEYMYMNFEKAKKIRSELKLEYLRNIFLNNLFLEDYRDLDLTEVNLQIIDNLSINSILVLEQLAKIEMEKNEEVIDIELRDTKKQNNIHSISDKLNIDLETVKVCYQELMNNAVIFDDGMNRAGIKAFDIVVITERGKSFLKFLKSPSSNVKKK